MNQEFTENFLFFNDFLTLKTGEFVGVFFSFKDGKYCNHSVLETASVLQSTLSEFFNSSRSFQYEEGLFSRILHAGKHFWHKFACLSPALTLTIPLVAGIWLGT